MNDSLIFRITDGFFTLDEPLILGPECSGTEELPIIFEADNGARPVFSGGRRITGFRETESGLWQTMIPEVAYKNWYFEQLYVNGQRAIRARSPNEGYYFMQGVKEHVWQKGKGRAPARAQQVIDVDPLDIFPLSNLTTSQLSDVVMTVYHKWDVTIRHLDGITDTTLITSGQGMKPWNFWRKNQRYILENFRVALDAPGEWFLERDGTLYYKPRPGEKIEKCEVIAPVLEKFVVLHGFAGGSRFVQNIHFKGLTFDYAGSHVPGSGFEPAQAAHSIEAVFQLDGVKQIRIENCEVAHTGSYGIWFRRGCFDSEVEKCYLHDLGAGGIRIGDVVLSENDTEITRHITLENNIIRSGGHLFPCAVGVFIAHSSDNLVNHNEIDDFYYTGVSVGWRWGYDYSPAKRNRITYNHIHHIGWGVLSDMAGVYTLGPSGGTVVNHNHIHHIYAFSYGGWGLYTDEGSSHILMENNLVHHTKTGGFHQHYGKENIIRNNIFALSKLYQIQATRVEDHLSFRFSNNIIYFTEGVLYHGPWQSLRAVIDSNCYWNPESSDIKFLQEDFSSWKKSGKDSHSIIADPYFENPQTGDFSFKNKSTYDRIQFIPFDYSECGVYGDPEWLEMAKMDQRRCEEFDELFKSGAIGERNSAANPVPSHEYRAAAAGWKNGGTWLDQHEEINNMGETRKIDLVFLGNSITQSWGGEGRNVWGPGEKVWEEFYGERNAANFGISGDRTQHILWRIDHGNFDHISPKVIVLTIGTNNLLYNSVDEIVEGIDLICERLRLKLPKTKIVLSGIFPRNASPDHPIRNKIQKINKKIRALSDGKSIYFIDVGKNFLDVHGNAKSGLFAGDFIHLRTKGYRVWAESLEPILIKLLGK